MSQNDRTALRRDIRTSLDFNRNTNRIWYAIISGTVYRRVLIMCSFLLLAAINCANSVSSDWHIIWFRSSSVCLG